MSVVSNMVRFSAVISAACFAAIGAAQTGTREATSVRQLQDSKSTIQGRESPERRLAAEAIADQALALPPEFGADITLRLLENNVFTDKIKRLELLDQVSLVARRASEPVPLRYLGGPSDAVSAYVAKGAGFGLDAVSLQTRVVRLMIPLDVVEARTHLERIRLSLPNKSSCADEVIPNFSAYYQTLGSLYPITFSRKELLEGRALMLLSQVIGATTSAVQIEPLANVLAATGLPEPDRAQLVSSLSAALRAIPEDARTFSAAAPGNAAALARLIQKTVAAGTASTGRSLAASYRDLVVRNLAAGYCTDLQQLLRRRKADEPLFAEDPVAREVARFNEVVVSSVPGGDDLRISESAVRERSISLGQRNSEVFWQTQESRTFLKRAAELSSSATEVSADQGHWSARVRELYIDLVSWEGSSEPSETIFFHEKALLLAHLLSITTSGNSLRPTRSARSPEPAKLADLPSRRQIVTDLFSFLSGAAGVHVRNERSIVWFAHVGHFLDLLRRQPADVRREYVEVLSSSRDPVLSLYGAVEKFLQN